MFLNHGRQDKQHPNHRNKISFRGSPGSKDTDWSRGREIGKQIRRSDIFVASANKTKPAPEERHLIKKRFRCRS
jgi:hypothetical protein